MARLIFVVLAVLTFARTIAQAQSKIIVPEPTSQVSDFDSEWCSKNRIAGPVARACFGRVNIEGVLGSRAILFNLASGEPLVYIESNPAAVELRASAFEIVGPVNSVHQAVLKNLAEQGQAWLTIDLHGEVSAVEARTPRLGRISASR